MDHLTPQQAFERTQVNDLFIVTWGPLIGKHIKQIRAHNAHAKIIDQSTCPVDKPNHSQNIILVLCKSRINEIANCSCSKRENKGVPKEIIEAKKEYVFTELSAVEIWSDYSYVQRGIEKSRRAVG